MEKCFTCSNDLSGIEILPETKNNFISTVTDINISSLLFQIFLLGSFLKLVIVYIVLCKYISNCTRSIYETFLSSGSYIIQNLLLYESAFTLSQGIYQKGNKIQVECRGIQLRLPDLILKGM